MCPDAPHHPATLLEALRAQLAAEGAAPSRRRLALLIAAGAARVEGQVARDPQQPVAPGARISFDADDLPADALARAPRTSAPPRLPAGVLHADAQVVVIERAAFPAGPPEACALAVARALRRERLWSVPDPSAPGSGPVLLAGSEAARRTLTTAYAAGRVLETLLSVRTPPALGPGEVLLERRQAVEQQRACEVGLVRREEQPPAPPPTTARDLLPSQRLALAFKHPRTNRRLVFEVGASRAFLEGLARLGLGAE